MKRKILIIVISVVILLLVGLIIFLNLNHGDKKRANSYNFNYEVVELPNTTTYENEKLASDHCIKDICISNVKFYYNDSEGRVEYNITNNSREYKSGYLKMVFKDQELLVAYKDLGPKKTIKSRSQYMGIEIKDKSDYTLRKLTKEEINKLKK